MAFKLNSGNKPSFKMMGADSPKKFNEKLEKAVDDGKIKGEFANAINNASDSPKEMKSPMDMGVGMMAARKIYGGDGGIETLKNISAATNKGRSGLRKMEDDSAMEMESAMKLKSAMDMAKDGPMEMGHSPKKLTQDAAMKMAAAMKKFYNKD